MMRLSTALSPRRGDVVSFVGAGGKTSAMYRLGRELVGQDWRVIVTTTTHIRPPALQAGEEMVVQEDLARATDLTATALSRNPLVTLAARHLPAENKLKGVPPGWVPALLPLADIILIEADGSRGLPIKAPAAHEPVVPAATSLLVLVVGVDAVGFPLNDTTAHRPALLAALTGLAVGDIITPAAVAALLVHPQGALKGAPAAARVAALINKVEDESALRTARQIAALVKSAPALERVLIGAVACGETIAVDAAQPIAECWRRVSAVVLAAGGSTRLGRPKQLLPVAGTTMVERVLRAVMATSVDEVIVVLGHAATDIAAHIPPGCRTVMNPAWQEGISSSIRAGLQVVDPRSEATLFVLADQPLLSSAALQRVLYGYYGSTRAIVTPVHHGQRGAPALFDRHLFPRLLSLRGDTGGREVIRQFPHEVLPVEMEEPEMFLDVDTAADYDRLRQHIEEDTA